MKTINWHEVLLSLWESKDTYRSAIATIQVRRKIFDYYLIASNLDPTEAPRCFSNHRQAIKYLENLQAQHNANLRYN